MTLALPWPFDARYMQLALAAGLVIGVCAPVIGAFLVQKRLSLMGDGIGHLAFAGVAAGSLVGVWPTAAALVVAVIGALSIEWLRTRGRASGDLALALFLYSGVALGVVLLSRDGSLNTSVGYLFGQLLTIDTSELWVIAGLGAVIVGTVGVAGRALFAVVLDEESARVAGLPVDRLNAMLAVLTAVTIVAAMRVVGLLLVAALMVLPVAAGQQLGRSFRSTVFWSALVGALSVVLGLTAARAWALAPGASIVLAAAGAFVVTSGLGRRRRGASALLGAAARPG